MKDYKGPYLFDPADEIRLDRARDFESIGYTPDDRVRRRLSASRENWRGRNQ
jgi:hypothetical protein